MKNEFRRLARGAILKAAREGGDPVDLMVPYAQRLRKMALEGDLDSATTLGAIKEIFDRVDGKATQELIAPSDEGRLVEAGLLTKMRDLLKQLPMRKAERLIGSGVVETVKAEKGESAP